MGHCGFDQMTRTIELMQVAKIFEAMTWTPRKDMAIEVAVRLLGAREEFDRSLNQGFDFSIFPMLQVGARRLEPFGDVGIPENAPSPIPVIHFLPATVHPLVEAQGIQVALMPHFAINMGQGDLSDLLLQVVPKAASERNPRLIERLPRGEHAMRFSLETASDARGGCGRIPVQFRHRRERGGKEERAR